MSELTNRERFLRGERFFTPSSKQHGWLDLNYQPYNAEKDLYIGQLFNKRTQVCSVYLIDPERDYITVAIQFFTSISTCNIYYDAMHFDERVIKR